MKFKVGDTVIVVNEKDTYYNDKFKVIGYYQHLVRVESFTPFRWTMSILEKNLKLCQLNEFKKKLRNL